MPPGNRRSLNGNLMREALERLDSAIDEPLQLIIGGGGAMILAYHFPLHTQDVDAFPRKGGDLHRVAAAARAVAAELDIEPDWLNQHFEQYTYVLPSDYGTRLVRVFSGAHLVVDALGPEDLLVMKSMAGRDKDRPHARLLMRRAKDLDLVDRQLSELARAGIPKAEMAGDFFDALRDEEDL